MMGRFRRYLKQAFDDKLFFGVMGLFGMAILLMALFVPVSKETERAEYAEGWNTREMTLAMGLAAEEADLLFDLKRVYDSEADFPKGLRIKWAEIQDTRILVVFERYRDLNPAYDRDYMAVYDVSGTWLYGVEGVLPYASTEIALMPDREGILFWEWKMQKTDDALFLVISPDGSKQKYVTEEIGSYTPAYWESEYRIIHTKESRLIAAHAETGEQTVVFDHSDAYQVMYPHSSHIDEEQGKLLDMLVPVFFAVVMILLIPWMMDNPNIPKRGMKEVHGDLRDRH